MKKILLFLGLIFISQSLIIAQQYKFKNYKMLDGLSQDFVYTIDQDKNGYLWMGTGEGLSKFNGIYFKNFFVTDSLAESVVTASFATTDGEIYFGHNEGGISVVNNDKITSLKSYTTARSMVKGIASVRNHVFFITQNEGLFHLSDKHVLTQIYHNKTVSYNNLALLNDSIFLIGTSNGAYAFSFLNDKVELSNHLLQEKNITALVYSKNQKCILAAITGDGVARIRLMNNELKSSYWSSSFDLGKHFVSSLLVDKSGALWLGTMGNGLIRYSINDINQKEEQTFFTTSNGLQSDFIQRIYEDHEGNLWIGLFGGGLSTFMDNFFVFYSHQDKTYGNSVLSVFIQGSDKWFGVENGLIHISSELPNGFEFFNSKNGLIDGRITALCMVDNQLWIGTESDGVFIYDFEKKKIIRFEWGLNTIEKNINKIIYTNNKVWIATYGGLLLYDVQTKEKMILNTQSGMPHNLIYTVCSDGKDGVLIGTKSNSIFKISDNGDLSEITLVEYGQLDIVDLIIDSKKQIWASTLENGIFKVEADRETISNINFTNGLKSNYCYAIAEDKKGSIWVGHSGSLSKINENEIRIFGQEHGITHLINHRSMYRDQDGYLWIGTNIGAIKYDASQDIKNKTAPLINIVRVWIGDKEVDFTEPIYLPYGEYRVKIEFVGISFKDPSAVKYRFKLEGFDSDYSELSTVNNAVYGRITDGTFSFKIIACNGDGVCGEETISVEIQVKTPFWKKWWFFVFCFLILASIVYSYIYIRTRNLKKIQDYLEYQLTIKTKEVVEQKEKIEDINKDLTSSINYAERIQRSMLPSTDVLSKSLPGSFVYYKPRDIVSGDFFFIKKIEYKLVVVCGDCTGHGVPGAFMSFIGGITLRHIYRSQYADSLIAPYIVLERLDMEVETILKQNSKAENNEEDEFYRTRDGMDIIICDIDLEGKTMRVSSAMRPFLIHRKGEFIIENGDRNSIGGGLEGHTKNFTLKTIQLEKGDQIYLFTDGITDQFGGERGRKLKLSGLKDLLEIVGYEKEEADKLKVINDFMNNWVEEKTQIDDILLVGISIT